MDQVAHLPPVVVAPWGRLGELLVSEHPERVGLSGHGIPLPTAILDHLVQLVVDLVEVGQRNFFPCPRIRRIVSIGPGRPGWPTWPPTSEAQVPREPSCPSDRPSSCGGSRKETWGRPGA